MRGDFARLTFDPTRHYTGVLHQQGRVWLEADWNEDVFDRQNLLWQETFDIIGACGVPEPGTAFKIGPNPDPASQPFDFLIAGGPGPLGRYYVDGILCQLEKPGVSYLSQPDFPDAPNIQMPTNGGDLHALVYLEVWQRLITYLEDDALREIALGGPDTATRLKTVAQVKVRTVSSDDAPGLSCAHADQFLPKPGQGTLTILQPTDSQPDDLCKLPDPSSYTGRENHLYRVEIHNGGDVIGSNTGFAFTQPLAHDAASGTVTLTLQNVLSSDQLDALNRAGVVSLTDSNGHMEIATVTAASTDSSSPTTQLTLAQGLGTGFTVANNATLTGGVARFKWSQDNAAFAVRVMAVSEDRLKLTLSSLGRDQATALRQLDLVEISDDASELGPARGHLTYLAADPDPDQFTVTIADPLPDNFHVNRHLVLRRWDGTGWANAAFDATTTPDMNLGEGIHIHFGGQDLRPGDYWQFAARSADGSVEVLTNAPPTGIIRHTCPLAIVEWNFQILFDIEMIVKACTQVGLTQDQLSLLIQKLKASGKSFWSASEVIALVQGVGATPDQVQKLSDLLASLGKERGPRLVFTVLEDCRQPFHPLTKLCCDCTVMVAPGDSLSAAFDKISGVGGTVCLLPGVYELTDTVLVSAKNGLTIRGAGAATIISASSIAVALRFVNCVNLTLRDLTIRSIQPIIGQSPAPHSETPASAPHPISASGFGPIDGVVTFTDCQAVRVTSCIVACAELPGGPHTCISFLGSSLSREISHLQQLQTQLPPSSGKMSEGLQASSPSTGAKTEEKKKGRRRGQHAQDSSPTTEAKSDTSSPDDAVSALTSFSPVTSAKAGGGGFPADFTLRDCRLYADTGQFGLLITTCIGVSIEDNWFFPLADLDPTSLETILQGVAQNQRASVALTFAQCEVLTVTNNLVLGFNSVLSANGGYFQLRDNVAVLCGDGFNISYSTSLRISDNVLTADTGPAVSINSGSGEAFLSGNDLVRLAASPEFAQNPPQVVSITADTVTLSNNNFHNQEASLNSSVTVTANRIAYTSNRSVCDNLPTIADVILLGPTDANGLTTGSITAVGNTCLEPTAVKVSQFESSLQDFRKQQANLVSQFIATQDPAQRQQLLQQLNPLDSQGQQLAQRLNVLVSSQGGSPSLLASATFTVTGMNLLSNILVRQGIGSDQGSVEGVF
jgi:Family of unknown function (DUF6519)